MQEQTYSIAQAAQRCGMSAHTLRYYDKEGLLPFVERNASGARVFKESDFSWLAMIRCLKNTGMQIKKIKEFIDWSLAGDATIEKRLNFLRQYKQSVEKQMLELQQHLDLIEYKIRYYEKERI